MGSKRVRQACTVCRDRKVRCDRVQPSCGRCLRLHERCSYDSSSGPTDLSRQVRGLQARLERAEERLSASRQGSLETGNPLAGSGVPPLMPLTENIDFLSFVPLADINSDAQLQPPAPTGFLDLFTQPNAESLSQEASSANIGQRQFDLMRDAETAAAMSELQCPVGSLPVDSGPMEDGTTSGNGQRGAFGLEPLDKEWAVLHHLFFEFVYHSLPILYQDRFLEEIAMQPHPRPLLALGYAVALVSAAISSPHQHLQKAYYAMTRKLLEECEMEGDGAEFANLNIFQALLFLLRYEIMASQITRAWMTLGRAIRLASVLNLQKMDARDLAGGIVPGLHVELPQTEDSVLLEERRRSFWCLFILETYVKTRSGMPCQLGHAVSFDVNLPSPGLLNRGLTPTDMPFLRDMAKSDEELSSYAACVIMVDLAIRAYEHGELSQSQAQGYWDRHFAMVKLIQECSAKMGSNPSKEAAVHDPVSLSNQLNLGAIKIMVHETAVVKGRVNDLSPSMIAENERSCQVAAQTIADTVRAVWENPSPERNLFTIQATFTAWPIAKAISTLVRDRADTCNLPSVQRMSDLKLLCSVLDYVEREGGYWHILIADDLVQVREWDEGMES
ncbi:fungal-specific transcription factor domain-containing protein [Fusarium solani]|uniref:Fungal-specific transcription factor domain-containing protein n=1 Tax=Fusarium solani TaxID=169388 RepID=A0A9P9H948_FUSSL|nr:fungal-specific transcription factor domain-containing protein [Fusarium solani]KAH7253399.1 fungal-specific transcription factor domain-containing protein [Fusarium solani]